LSATPRADNHGNSSRDYVRPHTAHNAHHTPDSRTVSRALFRGSRTPTRRPTATAAEAGSCTKCADCPCVSARPAVAVNSDAAAIVHMQSRRTRPGPRGLGTGLGGLGSCSRNCCGRPRAGGLLLSSRMKWAGEAATSPHRRSARACFVRELLSRCCACCCWAWACAWCLGRSVVVVWVVDSRCVRCADGSGDISRKELLMSDSGDMIGCEKPKQGTSARSL